MLNDYGSGLREFITTQGYNLRTVIEAHAVPAFESDVSSYPAVTCLPLEDSSTGTKIGIGVATGADKVFIADHKPDIEADRLLPLALASDLHGGRVKWSGHYGISKLRKKCGRLGNGSWEATAQRLGKIKSKPASPMRAATAQSPKART